MTERSIREMICEVGRRLYSRGLVAATEGNISYRLAANEILCTPCMLCKGFLRCEDLCMVDLEGNQLSGDRPRTSEIRLHLAIYKHRPEINAVVHSHPPHATAFAITRTPIPTGIHPEFEYFLGPVPLTPYATPGTAEFAETIVPFLDRTNTLLLASHGTVSFAADLMHALYLTEILDAYCRLLLLAKPLGPPAKLTEQQVAELLALKRTAGYDDSRL